METQILSGRRVALGVGGGIAVYKSCEIVRELVRRGAQVRVAMTHAAQAFVTPLTFQNLSGHPVLADPLDPHQDATFGHIELARWADVFVVAPATADLLARLRAGMANDAVTTSILAYRGNVLLAPAMNTVMWENAATQDNVAALAAQSRFRMVGPGAGLLACGEVGAGRLSEPLDVVAAVEALVTQGPLQGRRVLITAGPTREHLDPVRFLSNPATGKMGLALADAARARGAAVTVVLGPSTGVDRTRYQVVDVVTAEQMSQAVLERIDQAHVFVAAAAVSDYRPKETSAHKQKKTDGDTVVAFERTPDVLAQAAARVGDKDPRPVLVGFAAETQDVLTHAEEKLRRKRLDFIVANDISAPGVGFAVDTNRVTVLSRSGERYELAGSKREVADGIWNLVVPTGGA
ncbi:MAG: bifunctional phosphopantothenoylcysteine decarboxylase/phosphopantothenate--cysteine ligase CoaBC [Myxococcaceae bacterium]